MLVFFQPAVVLKACWLVLTLIQQPSHAELPGDKAYCSNA